MKITRTQLKQIITEELKKTLEGLSRKKNYTFVDLYEFSSLYLEAKKGGPTSVSVTGVDVSSATKIPITMTLSLADEEPIETLTSGGDGVPVPDSLLGKPFSVVNISAGAGIQQSFVLSR